MSILVNKISISVKIVGNSQFWSKLTKMSRKLLLNVDYRQTLRTMSILVKICKYLDFGEFVRNISLSVNIYENLENFRKISILDKRTGNSRFWSPLTKMSILDLIAENDDYNQIFKKCWFGSKFANISILVKNCRTISILENIFGKSRFKSISSVKSFFFYFFPQILVLVQISEKCRFRSKFANMSIWVKKIQKSRFGSTFSKIWILVKIVKTS